MLSNVKIVLAAQLAKVFVALLLQIMIARFLMPEARGVYALCIAMSAIFIVLTYFGNEFGIRYLLVTKQINAAQAASYLAVTILASMLVALALVWFAAIIEVSIFAGPTTMQIKLAVVLAFTQLLATQLNVVLTISQKYLEASILGVLEEMLRVGAVFFFALNSPSVETVLIAIIAANIISISIISTRHKFYKFSYSAFDIQHIFFTLRYGLKAFWINLGNLSTAQMGTLVLAGVLTNTQIGFYHLAFGLVARIQVIPDAINRVLVPVSFNSKSDDARLTMVQVASTALLAMVLVIVPVFFAFNKQIMTVLFGPEYTEAGILAAIILCGFAIRTIGKPLEAYFTEVVGRPGVTAKIQIAYVIAMASFTYFGGIVAGPVGAALGSAIAIIFGTLVLFFAFSVLTQRSVLTVVSFDTLLAEWKRSKRRK